jgi:hypothetical protein
MPTGLGDEKLWLCPSLDDSADDISGNGNHGTYNGGMGTVADTSNGGTRAYSFDGSDDFVDLTGSNFLSGTDEVSVSAWVYLDNHSDINIVYHESTDTSGALSRLVFLVRTDGQLRFGGRINDGNSFTVFASSAVSSVGIGSWHFVTGVCNFSSGIHRVYLDGSDITSSSTSTTGTFDANTPLAIKVGTNGTNDFDGLIDDIRIFDRALSTSEVTALASKRGYEVPAAGGDIPHALSSPFHPLG